MSWINSTKRAARPLTSMIGTSCPSTSKRKSTWRSTWCRASRKFRRHPLLYRSSRRGSRRWSGTNWTWSSSQDRPSSRWWKTGRRARRERFTALLGIKRARKTAFWLTSRSRKPTLLTSCGRDFWTFRRAVTTTRCWSRNSDLRTWSILMLHRWRRQRSTIISKARKWSVREVSPYGIWEMAACLDFRLFRG